MLADGAARVSDNCFLDALGYFERDGDGLEGEAVRVISGGPRRGHVCLILSALMLAQRVDGVCWGPLVRDPVFEVPRSGERGCYVEPAILLREGTVRNHCVMPASSALARVPSCNQAFALNNELAHRHTSKQFYAS